MVCLVFKLCGFWLYRLEGDYGVVKVMFRLVLLGMGVIVGGVVRIVLEMVGVENVLGK